MLNKIIIAILLLFINVGAAACSCIPQPRDISEAVNKAFSSASSVVLAKVESIQQTKTLVESLGEKNKVDSEITHFSEINSWKGEHGKQFYTKITTACCMCGISFEKGETYLLYLRGPSKDGFYSTSHCHRTKRHNTETDIAILNRISPNKSRHPTKAADE